MSRMAPAERSQEELQASELRSLRVNQARLVVTPFNSGKSGVSRLKDGDGGGAPLHRHLVSPPPLVGASLIGRQVKSNSTLVVISAKGYILPEAATASYTVGNLLCVSVVVGNNVSTISPSGPSLGKSRHYRLEKKQRFCRGLAIHG